MTLAEAKVEHFEVMVEWLYRGFPSRLDINVLWNAKEDFPEIEDLVALYVLAGHYCLPTLQVIAMDTLQDSSDLDNALCNLDATDKMKATFDRRSAMFT